MSKRKRQQIERTGMLQSNGWNVDSITLNHITFHAGNETPEHTGVKHYLCQAIKDNGHSFATEVTHSERGVCDVIDLYEDGPGCYIYEVETGCDKERRREKAKQYSDGFDAPEVTDVFVIDPTEAPRTMEACYEWCKEKVVE